MSNLTVLEGIQLVPVLELEPFKFSSQSRESPSASFGNLPEEWFRYWTDSLADSGIIGLRPLWQGSWHVPTVNFDLANLQRFLEKTIQEWGGIDALDDPDCKPVLDGGLTLACPASDLLVEPGCCADLGDANNWNDAAAYRGAEWKMLWIGHPWLSVRYHAPRLILSERHESDAPADRWAVFPEALDRAAEDAKMELERFGDDLAHVLPMLGYREDSVAMSRKLVGLCE